MLCDIRSVLTALLFATIILPLSASAGEVLYNGIVLPDVWPPRIEKLSREPMVVPYLEGEGRGVRGEGAAGRGGEGRPKVVPIDVGRQLFVDDFLVEETTLKRTYHRATLHPANPVLQPDSIRRWEMSSGGKPCSMVFSDGVWFDPAENIFKMWYMGGYTRSVCYATSKDGIAWDKPSLDVVRGTNIVLDAERDSTVIWPDPQDKDASRRYKMLVVTQCRDGRNGAFISIRYSADGINWGPSLIEKWVGGDRSSFFYNPFRGKWVHSIRYDDKQVGRARMYAECTDLVEGLQQLDKIGRLWTNADKLDQRNPNPKLSHIPPELYNLDAVAYESVMLGLFSIWQGDPAKELKLPKDKRNEIMLGFSRDGFHWHRPDRRPFIGVDESPGAWNWGNIQSAGGCCLVVGDQLYFYVSGRSEDRAKGPATTGLAILRRDGFASMDADDQPGTLTTRPVTFKGRHLFVNADVACGGELRVEVLDREGKVVDGLGMDDCLPFTADSTLASVKWKGAGDLGAMAGRPVRFRFHLKHGKLYAFWVSTDRSGASHGYVAAGGPGYAGPSDTIGSAAHPAAEAMLMQNICPTAPAIECPAWAKESVPVLVQPYRGKFGLPAPYPLMKEALGGCTAGIDMWQANHFVGYCPQTAKYLYEEYTPLKVDYVKGSLPYCEKVAAKYTAGCRSDIEKAMALLKRAIPENMGHPSILPYSKDVRPDRAMTEDELLKSGLGWCNEQARVFTRLCQISGIQARIIFLFYSDMDGHVISEFYADGRWCMADSSWGAVFPGADGKLMSAAQCHADAASKHLVQEAYVARARELVSASDEFLVGMRYKDISDPVERAKKIAENVRGLRENLQSGKQAGKLGDNLWAFGVMNLPSPR